MPTASPLANWAGPRLSQQEELDLLELDILKCKVGLAQAELGDLRKALARTHPLIMGRVYFSDMLPKESPPFHWEMVDIFIEADRCVFAAPVGSAKTTTLTKLGSIWSAMFEPVRDITIISQSADLVSTWLDDMSRRCKGSPEFCQDFGRFWGSHWGSDLLEFSVPEGDTRRTCFIRALGRGGALRGRRPDRIIVDDPQDEDSVQSDLQRDNFDNWFRGPVTNRLNTKGKKLCFVGTCFDEKAYVVDLIKNPREGWVTKSYAMLNEETNVSLWPEQYPLDFLKMRRAEIGEEKFQTEFQNNPVRFSHFKLFSAGLLKEEHRERPSKCWISIAVDPSYQPGADPWGITMVETTPDGHWHIRAAIKGTNGTEGWVEALFYLYKQTPRVSSVGVEANASQGGNKYIIEDQMKRRGVVLPITYLRMLGQKAAKSNRIGNYAKIYNQSRVTQEPGLMDLKREMMNYIANSDKAQDDALLDTLAMHLDLQMARGEQVHHEKTPDQLVHERYLGYARRVKSKPTSPWARYLPSDVRA